MIWTINKNSARNCKNIPAVASSAVIRKMALCTTFRRVTMSTALATATPAKKQKRILPTLKIRGGGLILQRFVSFLDSQYKKGGPQLKYGSQGSNQKQPP